MIYEWGIRHLSLIPLGVLRSTGLSTAYRIAPDGDTNYSCAPNMRYFPRAMSPAGVP